MQLDPSPQERQARLLEAAAQVGHAVTSLLDLDELFGQVVDIICDTYNFYYAGVFLIDPHQPQSAVLRTGRGEIGRKMVEQGHRLAIADTSMIGWCINHKQARIAPNVGLDAVRIGSPLLPETRSEMALPLIVGDEVIGALTIQSAVENPFTELDITSLQAIAGPLAIAIDNARTHTQAQRRAHLVGGEKGQQMNRIVFMGTPEFAVPTLQILADHFEVVGVFTQPAKPAGRGQQLTAPPIELFAQERGLPVFQPRTLRDEAVQAQLAALQPDAIVVAAYGLLLPKAVLDLPPHGCVNVHASLLPRYRGAAPIHAAILNGEAETGVTLMRMDEGLDTGPMMAQAVMPIGADDTAGTLTTRLAELGARMIAEVLPNWIAGELALQPQDESRATFAPKLNKADGRLDWSQSAMSLDRRVRAFSPAPGTFTKWNGKLLRILSVQVTGCTSLKGRGPASQDTVGLVARDGNDIVVVTGNGTLRLVEIQLEGKRAMSAQDFARGQPTFIGSVLGGE